MTEDEMAGWQHQLDGHEFEQAPGVGDGQGGLACCDSWGHKELDMTERLKTEAASIWHFCTARYPILSFHDLRHPGDEIVVLLPNPTLVAQW